MPQFLMICRDRTDIQSWVERVPMRAAHLNVVRPLVKARHLMVGAGLLNDAGKIIGSIGIFDFPNRAQLDEYMSRDPYSRFWEVVEVHEIWVKFYAGEEREYPEER